MFCGHTEAVPQLPPLQGKWGKRNPGVVGISGDRLVRGMMMNRLTAARMDIRAGQPREPFFGPGLASFVVFTI